MYRMWPHKLLGEGHFAAVLRRTDDRQPEEVPALRGDKLPKEWVAFAGEAGIRLPEGKAVAFGETLYWTPQQTPELKGIPVLRAGLELGQCRKGRFEPAHALAMWLKTARNVHTLAWDSPQTRAYLHGDTIPASVVGWCLVTLDGYTIGWGKGDGKVLKNHYPKGLRR